jgi:cytochrome c-type biogenesis protein
LTDLEPLLQNVTALTPLMIALVALAGLVVGIRRAPFRCCRSLPGRPPAEVQQTRLTVPPEDFGCQQALPSASLRWTPCSVPCSAWPAFAVLRVLASFLAVAYGLLGVILALTGLALLRITHVVIPVLAPSPKPTRTFVGSYLLGLPFGLSTCPACTPLLLPAVVAAASTADPILGAALMFTFGLARGIPIVATGTAVGTLAHLRRTRGFIRWAERAGGVLMLAAAIYFLYQVTIFAGWLPP